MKRRKKAVLCAVLASLMFCSSARQISVINVLADTAVSEVKALSEAVNLYERLTDTEVPVPDELTETGLDIDILKSVMLGYINLDDTEESQQEMSIRKQDFMSVLYKTIVSYNDSYTIYEDEANLILNKCYDNAYIDEENRVAYAFMIKQGIISSGINSEPNKEITNDECEKLINAVYDNFAGNVTVTVGECDITVGANIQTVFDVLGMPNRIDQTEYGFEWYVYNSDYSKFCMVGVEGDRICAVYSNGSEFEINGIKSGDDFVRTEEYSDSKLLKFYHDANGKVDGVLYNPREKGVDENTSVKRSKSLIMLDIINAYRSKNMKPIYVEDSQMSSNTWFLTRDFNQDQETDNNITTQSGEDVFDVYSELLTQENDILTRDLMYSASVGINTVTDEEGNIQFSIMTSDSIAVLPAPGIVEIPEEDYTLNEVEEVTTPVLKSPTSDSEYKKGDDVVIELEMQASTKYLVEMFDIENDEYAVNEYITTDDTKITLPAELFKEGSDYRLTVSSITPTGESLSGEEVLVSYGSAYDSGVNIVTPYNDGVTDDDYIEITWESDQYHDFYVDLYDQNNDLIVSKVVEDEYEAVIQGVDPGKYFLYITALRRGSRVEKAQDCVTFTVQSPEPVINEIILDKDDKYYFVYEDEELGLLYFYDEELVDVDEEDENGNVTTVTKKKIIQKQVKATKGYRELAKYRSTPEYTTGEPVIRNYNLSTDTSMGNAILAEAEKYLGVPYVWGGTSPSGFDCSGLVQYVCNSLGISVNRVAEDQFKNGTPVNKDELQPGDLVFFEQNGYIHHVGIYAGDGMMLHAPRTGDVVKYQSIETDYYRSEYAGARRVY